MILILALPSSAAAGAGYIALAVAAALLAAIVSAWIRPWRHCRWCRMGRWYRPDGRVWRDCWFCGGTGRRRRLLARRARRSR
jgi:hypothetical protein